MSACLKDAGIAPDSVDYINAHGTGTTANDVTETKAIHMVFGERAKSLAISSTKSLHGHTLGAAGAIEAAVTVLALRDQVLPPTINYEIADPMCDLDCIPNHARHYEFDVALSNSFGFGGHNAVLVFTRPSLAPHAGPA